MTYADRNAVYAINRYVNRLLEVNMDWTNVTYTNALGQTVSSNRIIPSAQQPELLATGKSFVVYGSSIQQPGHLYVEHKETVAYTIYSPSSTEVNKITNFLFDVFKRQDEAVSDVNYWLDREREVRGIDRYLSFTSINPTMIEKAEPADEEGAYVSALFLMDISYVVFNDTFVTRPGQGAWTAP